MSESDAHSSSNVYSIGAAPAAAIRANIAALREAAVGAWREWAVVLTREEQEQLKQEIADTCELLRLLVHFDER